VLTAGELLYLLALRTQRRADTYEVPQVMGPTDGEPASTADPSQEAASQRVVGQIIEAVNGSSYLPSTLDGETGRVSPEAALIALACRATGTDPSEVSCWNPSLDAVPNLVEATEKVKGYEAWAPHGPQYNQEGILKHFRLQAWTLKPALQSGQYPEGVGLGRDLNAMVV
jgi:hypothetical protein